MKKLFLTLSLGILVSPLNVVAEDSEEVESLKIEIKETEEHLRELKSKLKELTGDDKVLVDSDLLYIEFDEIVERDIKTDFMFLVENKSDEDLVIQIRGLSIDGVMVDETIVVMSTEVRAGKEAKAKLELYDFEDYDFPELVGMMEGEFSIFSDTDMDLYEDYEFEIDLDNLE